jgi:large subunit ribosomal protein L22
MEVVATAKSVRITARKARVVADSVVGLSVAEAKLLLQFTPRHAAREIRKVIRSAEANAEHNYNLDVSDLRIARIDVEQAGIIKRYIPKPRGQAGSLFKRMSHLRVYVTDDAPAPKAKKRSLVAMPRQVAPVTMGQSGTARRRRPAKVEAEAPVEETVEATEATESADTAPQAEAPAPRKRRTSKAKAEAAETETTTDEAGTATEPAADDTAEGDQE